MVDYMPRTVQTGQEKDNQITQSYSVYLVGVNVDPSSAHNSGYHFTVC